MDRVTKLAKLMSDSLYTWSDEELVDLFLDSSITWEYDGFRKSFSTRAEKIAYLAKQGFDIVKLIGVSS